MLTATCIQKFKKNNRIYGYRLQDSQGNTKDVYSDQLKTAIRNNQIAITNLTLTSDNRLVGTTEKQPQKTSWEQNVRNAMIKARAMGISFQDANYDLMVQIQKNTNITDFSDDLIADDDPASLSSNFLIKTPFFNDYDDNAGTMEIDIAFAQYVSFKYLHSMDGRKLGIQELYGFQVDSLSTKITYIVKAYNTFEKLYNKYGKSKCFIYTNDNKVRKFESQSEYYESINS